MPAPSRKLIIEHLLLADPRLRPVIETVEFPVAKRHRDIYAALLHSIVSQQLSIKAANTIHARLLALFPDNYPSPELLLEMPFERLRGAGLSRQKSAYIKGIAEFALNDGMAYERLNKLSAEEITRHLTSIHGVGQWTVEMLLIFAFNRRDIFSVDDVGIQNAMRHLYRLKSEGKVLKQRMLKIADRWRPYRSIVCRYLWGWKAIGYRRST
jgi:DNA-3-methyladenine glycosylase II